MRSFKNFFLVLVLFVSGTAVWYYYPESRLPKKQKIDFLRVSKSKREMIAYYKDSIVQRYKISLGDSPIGHKKFEGDEKTPEGVYTIFNKNPNSGYFKNLGISYPNSKDKSNAEKLGKPPGGDIKIHGLPNNQEYIGKFHRWKDWTNGCIAVTNEEMEELYNAVIMGSKINISP